MAALIGIAVVGAVAAAAGITGSIVAATPTKSEKERKQRLEDLRKSTKKRFRKGDWGLDAAEREDLANVGLASVQGAEREYYSRQNELAALQGITGGALIQQDLARQEAAERRRGEVSSEIRRFDLATRQAEINEAKVELSNLEAQVSADQARKKGASVAAVQETAQSAMDVATFAYMMEMKYGGDPMFTEPQGAHGDPVWSAEKGAWVYPMPGSMGGETPKYTTND